MFFVILFSNGYEWISLRRLAISESWEGVLIQLLQALSYFTHNRPVITASMIWLWFVCSLRVANLPQFSSFPTFGATKCTLEVMSDCRFERDVLNRAAVSPSAEHLRFFGTYLGMSIWRFPIQKWWVLTIKPYKATSLGVPLVDMPLILWLAIIMNKWMFNDVQWHLCIGYSNLLTSWGRLTHGIESGSVSSIFLWEFNDCKGHTTRYSVHLFGHIHVMVCAAQSVSASGSSKVLQAALAYHDLGLWSDSELQSNCNGCNGGFTQLFLTYRQTKLSTKLGKLFVR